jgi:hypothetical protein
MKYNVILLSYEITKGMKSFGSKCLLPVKVNNKVDFLLNHQINLLQKSLGSVEKFLLVLGFDIEKICKKIHFGDDIEIINNEAYRSYGQSYALSLALSKIDNKYPTLILMSGILIKSPLNINTDNNIVFVTNNKNSSFRLGCTLVDNRVEYLFYNLEPYWAECLLVQPQHLDRFIDLTNSNKNMLFFEIINKSLEYCETESYKINNTYINNIVNMK